MLSLFIVQHNQCQVFQLSEEEYENALRHYPQLENADNQLNFFPFSANAWITPKKDCYFDNETILKQFERLFLLLKFKEAFKGLNSFLAALNKTKKIFKKNCLGFEIEIIVVNAKTHTAKI